MAESKSNPELVAWIHQLESSDSSMADKALKKVSKQAGIKELPLIIATLAKIQDNRVQEGLTAYLASIKSKGAPAIFAAALTDPELLSIRKLLTRACWESQMDFSPYLIQFAHLLIAGDFELSLEAFSVVENTFLDRPVNPEIGKEIISLLVNSVPDQPEVKQRLIRELLVAIEPFA